MKKIVVLSFTFFALLFVVSCVSIHTVPTIGSYSGKFSVKQGNELQEGDVKIVLQSGKYTCTSNPNYVPAGGSGTYHFDKDSVTFIDEHMYTANFDWNLLLNGKYAYQVKKGRLTLTVTKDDGTIYTYTLNKD